MSKITNINLFVKDVERSAKFYKNVFGLEEIEDRAARPSFVRLRAGGCNLSLQEAGKVGMENEPLGGFEIGFEVDDVSAIIEKLRAENTEVGELQQMGWGSAADARDPDGHRLNFFQSKQR